MKALVLAAKTVAGRKAGECPDCGGSGEIPELFGCKGSKLCVKPECEHWHEEGCSNAFKCTCPTCARLREIAEWCWHEKGRQVRRGATNEYVWTHCSICDKEFSGGNVYNPTFTVQTVRALLEDLGEFDNMISWLAEFQHPHRMAGCLTDDKLIVQAATTFLEGQHGT